MIIKSSIGFLSAFILGTLPVMGTECPHPEGEWIATEHYAARLLGEITERIDLHLAPGGEQSPAYGLGQDPVIAIAEACVAGVMWKQIKFPAERYGKETLAWIPATLVRLH